LILIDNLSSILVLYNCCLIWLAVSELKT
jgi:hypothetical protein